MPASSQPLRVLLVEDNSDDADLLIFELRRAGFAVTSARVDREPDFITELLKPIDIVLSDYAMPQFSGLRALEILQERGLAIPFILVSGTIGEELAVAAMKNGASDYLLKDRLSRLGPAVSQALREKELRRQAKVADDSVQRSEQRLREIFDGILGFVGLFTPAGRIVEMNQPALKTVNLTRADLVGTAFAAGPWWRHSPEMQERVSNALREAANGRTVNVELVAGIQGGNFIYVDSSFNPLRDASGVVTAVVGSGIDVTARQEGQTKIKDQLDELLRWQEVMMNREDRVQALKAEVNALLVQLGQPIRYASSGTT